MRAFFLLLGFAFGGGVILEWPGVIIGFLFGLTYLEFNKLRNKIDRLETQLESKNIIEPEKKSVTYDVIEPSASVTETSPEIQRPAYKESLPREGKITPAAIESDIEKPDPARPDLTTAPSSPVSDAIYSTANFIKKFFTTGNVVAKVGIIVVFFGVGFLLKFIAQHALLPIEARLFGVALGGLIMLIAGWRMRTNRLTYGLILQGGGIGILYLTLFATAKQYYLIPIILAFGIMVGLVILSAILAVLQDSKALAGFGAIGGFLAPVLMSTGSGNHVVLFSYYALLDAGILGIAWFRAWRELNLIGFVFTFTIGLMWGNRYYQPSYFVSTEPFLIIFFLFYAAISVLFALRQPVHLKGYLDSTLVFGTPLITFGLQSALVHNFEYGLSISALAMGGFYIQLATTLWRKKIDGMRLLTEAFLAFGVVFGSLAIPLALDGRWTASSWTLEGAALVWVGLHQRRLLARNFGLLLQLGASVSFLITLQEATGDIPVFNSFYISCLLISLSALFSSYMLQSFMDILKKWEKDFHLLMLTLGLLWWFGSGFHELDIHLSIPDLYISLLLLISLSSLGMSFAGIRLEWSALQFPPIGLLPAVIFLVGANIRLIDDFHPFMRWGAFGWLIALPVHFWQLYYFEKIWPQKIIIWLHLLSLWFLAILLSFEAGWLINWFTDGAGTWKFVAWGVVPGIFVFSLMEKGQKLRWPVQRFSSEYLGLGNPPLIVYLMIWNLAVCFLSGDPYPLQYLPILSPLDLTQLFSLFIIVRCALLIYRKELPLKYNLDVRVLAYTPALIFFAWLNSLVARTVHFYGSIDFSINGLFSSIIFQSAISIVWTLTALFITVWATRKGFREVWFTGAALISLVVVKLFIVDLASTGTIARIISFLVVGALMLLIGYLSPLPVRQEEK